LTELTTIFLNNLLPVILAAGAGYLLAYFFDVNPRPLSKLVFYVFSPSLIFILLTQSELSNGDILTTVLFASILITIVIALTWLAGTLLKLDRRTLSAVILTSAFVNAGNFGLSVVLFAFGKSALSYASLFFVTNTLLAYSLGVIIASMGSVSLSQAFINLLKIPTLYALILALVFMLTKWQVPLPLERTFSLLGDAAIPGMLVLLGMQFKDVTWSGKAKPITLSTVMRLLVSPILALLLSRLFGLTGPSRQASVLEAATPSAVLNTVLATEFDVEPTLVTATVFVTTLLSPLTITPLLAYLGT